MHPGPNGRLVSLALPVIVEHAEPDSISVVSEVNRVVTGVIRPSFSQLGVILAQDERSGIGRVPSGKIDSSKNSVVWLPLSETYIHACEYVVSAMYGPAAGPVVSALSPAR